MVKYYPNFILSYVQLILLLELSFDCSRKMLLFDQENMYTELLL